jgi:hypothetical protein
MGRNKSRASTAGWVAAILVLSLSELGVLSESCWVCDWWLLPRGGPGPRLQRFLQGGEEERASLDAGTRPGLILPRGSIGSELGEGPVTKERSWISK